MPLDQRPHVHRGDLALAHQYASIHDRVVGLVAGAQQERSHRVVHRAAGHAQGVRAKHCDVGAKANLDLPQLVRASQHFGAATGGQAQGIARGHLGWTVVTAKCCTPVFDARWLHRSPDPRQQHGLAGFVEHVRRVVAGAAVYAQTNRHAGVQHFAQGQDAAGQSHIAAGAVGNAGAGAGKQVGAFFVELDAVGVPHVGAHPAEVLGVLRGGAVELFAGVGHVVVVLCQVRVQSHAVGAGQFGRFAHQVLAHAKGRAGRHGHMRHRPKARVVPSLDQALGFFQDGGLFFDHAVGRQAALRLPHAHAAARGGEAHADGVRGFDAVV